MKRSWIGFALLLVLLVISAITTWGMTKIHEPIEKDLKQAAECAILGDWENAGHFFQESRNRWEDWKHLRACFADHTPVEEIDSSFALLEVYCYAQENAAFAAECCRLARQTAAVGEAHELAWWNML